jgi:hypothetical protein
MGLFGGKKRKQRLEEAGVNAAAQIVEVRDTGMTVNNNPRVAITMQVAPSDGSAPFAVSTKQTVSRVAIPRAGDAFVVRYDPDDHDNFAIVGAMEAPDASGAGNQFLDDASAGQIAAAATAAPDEVQRGSAAQLLASGQRMTAIVREFSPTGKTVGDVDPTKPDPNDPVYVFKVELATGGTPIEATFMHRVPEAKAPTLALGEQLSVAVNPANPTREVAIDWDASPVA